MVNDLYCNESLRVTDRIGPFLESNSGCGREGIGSHFSPPIVGFLCLTQKSHLPSGPVLALPLAHLLWSPFAFNAFDSLYVGLFPLFADFASPDSLRGSAGMAISFALVFLVVFFYLFRHYF